MHPVHTLPALSSAAGPVGRDVFVFSKTHVSMEPAPDSAVCGSGSRELCCGHLVLSAPGFDASLEVFPFLPEDNTY